MSDSKAAILMSNVKFPPIPAGTAREAESVFGRDHLYIKIGRNLEQIWADLDHEALEFLNANTAKTFQTYSLVTIFQYWEGLTSSQMAQAVRVRTDLKYALHLPLTYPGFKTGVLCNFRQELQTCPSNMQLFWSMYSQLNGLSRQKENAREAKQLIAAVCQMDRIEAILEVMNHSLEAVAAKYPKWLLTNALPHWFERYRRKPGTKQIPQDPEKIESFIQGIGKDGQHLLDTIEKNDPSDGSALPEITILGREWRKQFEKNDGVFKLRSMDCRICSRGIAS